MGHVFVSYSHRDRESVNQLVEELQKHGVIIWRDLDLSPGANWASEIYKALIEADALIVAVSENSMQSPYVESEWKSALEMGKPIIPVIVGSKDAFPELPAGLAELYMVNLRKLSLDKALKKILEVVPKSSRQEQPQEPKLPQSKGYVFISYASQNQNFVEQLRDFMEKRGYGYWDYKKLIGSIICLFTLSLKQPSVAAA